MCRGIIIFFSGEITNKTSRSIESSHVVAQRSSSAVANVLRRVLQRRAARSVRDQRADDCSLCISSLTATTDIDAQQHSALNNAG